MIMSGSTTRVRGRSRYRRGQAGRDGTHISFRPARSPGRARHRLEPARPGSVARIPDVRGAGRLAWAIRRPRPAARTSALSSTDSPVESLEPVLALLPASRAALMAGVRRVRRVQHDQDAGEDDQRLDGDGRPPVFRIAKRDGHESRQGDRPGDRPPHVVAGKQGPHESARVLGTEHLENDRAPRRTRRTGCFPPRPSRRPGKPNQRSPSGNVPTRMLLLPRMLRLTRMGWALRPYRPGLITTLGAGDASGNRRTMRTTRAECIRGPGSTARKPAEPSCAGRLPRGEDAGSISEESCPTRGAPERCKSRRQTAGGFSRLPEPRSPCRT